MDLLRKKDLHEPLKVPKSTVADWLTEFHVYIPTVKHGNVTYYKTETKDVLRFIKELRDLNYSKTQIMLSLSEKGFPITVEEAVEDMRKIIHDEGGNYRDTLLTVMQTMGQAVSELAEQNKALNSISQEQSVLDGRMTDAERKLEKLDEIEQLRQQMGVQAEQIAKLTAEIAAANEQKKGGFMSRLFGRK